LSPTISNRDVAKYSVKTFDGTKNSKEKLKMKHLEDYSVFHAGRRKIRHPDLEREIYSQTAVRYIRFLRKVKLDYLELFPTSKSTLSGRWIPAVPTHPAHLIISTFNSKAKRWKVIKEVDLPLNPKFAGEGLSQDVGIDEMQDFFKTALAEQAAHRIDLDGTVCDCVKVECDREHPVWANHGECNGGPFNVPFGILQPMNAFGEELEEFAFPRYNKKIEKIKFAPSAPEGMTINTENPLEIVFTGKKLSIGFSLLRPMITQLALDYSGEGDIHGNRLFFKGCPYPEYLRGLNGPSYLTTAGNFCAQNMTGKISVEGNRVRYDNIETGCGISLKAVFTIEAEAVTLEFEQNALRDTPVLEGEAWRLLWDMRAGMTSVAGIPDEQEGRNGFVKMPALIAADESGCLSVELKSGKGAFHTESYKNLEARSTAFVLAERDNSEAPLVIPEGISKAVFEMRPEVLLPVPRERENTLSAGVKKCWTAGFTAFRAEFGGFSNNSISTNCHVNQHCALDFAAFTAKASCGMEPMELVKFSIGRALMDGGGYGYHRCLYLDSDPVLLSGAGRIFQLTGDQKWLERVRPGIIAAAKRIKEHFDEREGMLVCRALSGNSGTYRWSSNAMDVIGFGHIDAYVNAWAFRAMKNADVMFRLLGEDSLAGNCEEIAAALSENYARQLVNPETGWVSGWRSRDGQLHDFGFIFINGIAGAFGVMEESATRKALGNLAKSARESGKKTAGNLSGIRIFRTAVESSADKRDRSYALPKHSLQTYSLV